MQTTTSAGLQARQDAPLILPSAGESLNPTRLRHANQVGDGAMPCIHSGSGCHGSDAASVSGKHTVFVLGVDGVPLTPTTPTKARKLLNAKQAVPAWNKFGVFGIRMLVSTRKETPPTVLGLDFGTKFEGYAVATGKENSASVMWLLPSKEKLVKKLEERHILRRAKRQRNCRRRECRSDNRSKAGFIAPSQLLIINSRQKAMRELLRCFPVSSIALEDVRFNHRDHKWGKNFSTVEIGKRMLYGWLRGFAPLQMYEGFETGMCRDLYGYKKSGVKNAEVFNAHCSDALAIAADAGIQQRIEPGRFIVCDDTYRPVRRQLHDTQPAKGGVRAAYSSGNFRGVRKGTMCEHGQICGGTKKSYWIRNNENKRIGRVKVSWFSKHFKNKNGRLLPSLKRGVSDARGAL